MTKEQKTAVKEKAEKVATFFGYNMGDTASEMLHAINLREMYCQGYSQAMIDNPSTPSIEYAISVLEEVDSACLKMLVDSGLSTEEFAVKAWKQTGWAGKIAAKIQELKSLLK